MYAMGCRIIVHVSMNNYKLWVTLFGLHCTQRKEPVFATLNIIILHVRSNTSTPPNIYTL